MSARQPRRAPSLIAQGFALPWILGLLALWLLPAAASFALSFCQLDFRDASPSVHWVGLEHYRRARISLLVDPPGSNSRSSTSDGPSVSLDTVLPQALRNSLLFSLIAVPLSVTFALSCAMLLSRPMRIGHGLRMIFYLPHVLSSAASLLIWAWIFNPRFGPLNQVWSQGAAAVNRLVSLAGASPWLGTQGPDWLHSQHWAKPAVVIIHVWATGNAILIFWAALRGVQAAMLEAALLDGAGPWSRWWYVWWPQLGPVVAFNLIVEWIYAMQCFTPAYLLYNRDQGGSLVFYMLHLYRSAFESPPQLGYACALAWILVLLLALPIALLAASRRAWINYDTEVE